MISFPLCRFVVFFVAFSAVLQLKAQNSVGIGTENSNNNAVLELVSPNNNQGFLVPRLTTAQRNSASFTNNLSANENGLLVFDSDEKRFYYWQDNAWRQIKNGPELTAGVGIAIQNGQIVNTGDTDATDDFDGNFSSLIGIPAGIADGDDVIDSDADPQNEIQDLQLIGNELRITNNPSASVIDLAPFSGTNTDNQTLSFSSNQLTIARGNTVNLSGLINDADADPTNELQNISLSGSNLILSDGGGSVGLFSGNFSDLVGIPSGIADGDDVGPTYSAGSGISISGNTIVNTGDLSATNEIQNLSTVTSGNNRTINITGGTGTTFSVADGDASPTNEIQNLSTVTSGNNRTINITGGTGTTFSVADGDASPTNEIQDLSTVVSGNNRTINITGGTGTTFSVADADANSTNEIQTLSKSGNLISLSNGGGSVDIADRIGFRAAKSTGQSLVRNVSSVITFQQVIYDLSGDYDGNSIFNVKIPGIYNISGLITIQMDAAVDAQLEILIDGVSAHTVLAQSANNTDSFSFSTDIQLSEGQRVQIGVLAFASGNIIGTRERTNWNARLMINLN